MAISKPLIWMANDKNKNECLSDIFFIFTPAYQQQLFTYYITLFIPLFYVEETTIMLDANTEHGHNLKGIGMGRHNACNSGILESLEDRDIEYLHNKRR